MSSNNEIKLKAIVQFFGLSVSSIAKVTDMSVPYVSRILSQNGNHIEGSNRFWLALEQSLGQLVQKRKNQIFEVTPVDASRAEVLLKSAWPTLELSETDYLDSPAGFLTYFSVKNLQPANISAVKNVEKKNSAEIILQDARGK